jgi:hypothetical protein
MFQLALHPKHVIVNFSRNSLLLYLISEDTIDLPVPEVRNESKITHNITCYNMSCLTYIFI